MISAVETMLEGGAGILLPRSRDGQIRSFADDAFDPADTPRQAPALVLFTSGSTGTPKGVALSADALVASARATEGLLSGPGRWHLCLPVNHIAGLQVVLRALLAGAPPTSPSPVPAGAPAFDPLRFAEDLTGTLSSAGSQPVYTSLVPTQLTRILTVPQAARVLARTAAVLLGGASISPRLLERASDAGIPIVRTYGMSETAGGCVYDGLPFPDVTVRISPDGRIVLAGPVLADGYVHVEDHTRAAGTDTAAEAPVTFTAIPHHSLAPGIGSLDVASSGTDSHDGQSFGGGALGTSLELAGGFHGEGTERFLVTSDLGRWEENVGLVPRTGPPLRARIAVLGRADDVIVTGGENVSPHEVETALLPIAESLGFSEVLVTSRADAEWGEVLVALLVPHSDATRTPHVQGEQHARPGILEAFRMDLRERGMTGARVPRHVLVVDDLPVKSIGKPDRAGARVLANSLRHSGG